MSFDRDTLWGLLPAIHRIRDEETAARTSLLTPAEDSALQLLEVRVLRGDTLSPADSAERIALLDKAGSGPLRSLLRVIAEQVAQVEEDIDQLYDDQFIETCAPWVVPYIGDLIGHRLLRADRLGAPRAEVANTIGYRRRKGTSAVLADGAFDLTGAPAVAVEYFQRLAVTQHLHRVRPLVGTASLRVAADPALSGGPFDPCAHGAEVGSIGIVPRRRFNIPNVGIHLWTAPVATRSGAPAFRVDAQRFLFDALGIDQKLLSVPPPADAAGPVPAERRVPLALTRRRFAAAPEAYFGPGRSLAIAIDGAPVDVTDIAVCCLQDLGADPNTSNWPAPPAGKIAIDPELGRIALPAPLDAAKSVVVSYAFAGTDPVGAGEFSRIAGFATDLRPLVQVPRLQPSLSAALASPGFAGSGVIEVVASGAMPEAAAPLAIRVAAQARLEIRAGETTAPVAMPPGPVLVTGGDGGEVTLNGFTLVGQPIRVPAMDGAQPNRLQRLRLVNCTLVPGLSLDRAGAPASPGAPSLIVEAEDVIVEIEGCITGALRIARDSRASISDSVVDAGDAANLVYADPDNAAPGGPLALDAATLRGRILTEQASLVSNALLLGVAESVRKQQGVVRYSFVAPGSALPRRFACVPAEGASLPRPLFRSGRFGTPGYLRLAPATDPSIRAGADNDGQMGAWHGTGEALRLAQLDTWLQDYMRFGLSSGVFIEG